MSTVKIVPIQPNEIDAAADLLSRAFIMTPFSSKVAGGQEDKHRHRLQFGFRSMLAKKPGRVMVAKEGDTIVGVMRMVEWPDCQNSAPKGLGRILLLIFGGRTGRRFINFRKIWARHDPKTPHWHIDPLGVLPEKQGQGIGSKLLTYFCEYIDERGQPAYHETDTVENVRLYKRFGYRIIETEPIFSITNWFLWRPPHFKEPAA